MTFFSRSGIEVKLRDTKETLLQLHGAEQVFELPEAGVYALEGDNQSGKSLLVKALLGVRVNGLEVGSASGSVVLEDKRLPVTDLADAMLHGMVGVFQDDVLIPSMTIEEQLNLRHATPGARAVYAWTAKLVGFDTYAHAAVEAATGPRRLLRSLLPRERDLHHSLYVQELARSLFRDYGDESILEKYPHQLSGGARAIARLVQAQLTPRIRLLVLDEAFANVDEKTLPFLVSRLREWRAKHNAAILVVTHNPWERHLWNPRITFRIARRTMSYTSEAEHTLVLSALPAQVTEFKVYSEASSAPFAELFKDVVHFFVFVDDQVIDNPATLELRARLTSLGKAITDFPVSGGEKSKSFESYSALLMLVARTAPPGRIGFVIIGGGVTLNLAGFVAATFHRGRHPSLLVPTTAMAIADVAVGSKTGVNLDLDGTVLKHAAGSYQNPSCVIVDRRYLDTLGENERLRGLSECLKHGLLQDRALFDDVAHLIRTDATDRHLLFRCCMRTMELKSRVLRVDPFERDVGRILLYGHLHAHSIERALAPNGSHGDCVFIGLLVELYLTSRESEAYRLVRAVVEPLRRSLYAHFQLPDWATLERAYRLDQYNDVRRYPAIQISAIGEYADPGRAELRETVVEPHDIKAALEAVREILGI